jgi:elongation factor Ts
MQAEAWLRDRAQKEGWAKASKLQSRSMSQGLIGIATQDKAAAIVEVGFFWHFW